MLFPNTLRKRITSGTNSNATKEPGFLKPWETWKPKLISNTFKAQNYYKRNLEINTKHRAENSIKFQFQLPINHWRHVSQSVAS